MGEEKGGVWEGDGQRTKGSVQLPTNRECNGEGGLQCIL